MDFSFVLFIGTLVSGAIIAMYRLVPFLSHRNTPIARKPALLEFARSLFPILLIVFLVRSFVVEPFRIPSGSMLPNLHIGDFILVNKYQYGIRLPILNKEIISVDQPQRGDVMVFRYPKDPSINFVKRVIGLPGDIISYQNKQLTINGEVSNLQPDGDYIFQTGNLKGQQTGQFIETIGDVKNKVLFDPSIPRNSIKRATVPEGYYFVMGDNRDWSNDSRSWGFVPNQNIIGKAFFIWFSWKGLDNGWVDWSRIGDSIKP